MLAGGAVVAAVLAWGTGAGAESVALDDVALEAAALRLTDLPAGWQPVPPDFVERVTTADPTGGPCGTPNTDALAQAQGATGAAFVAFTADASLPGAVYERLYSFPSSAAAKAFAAEDPSCTEWDQDGWTLTRRILRGPKVGGPTTRVQVDGTRTPGTVEFAEDVLVVRRANNVLAVGQDRYDGTIPPARETTRYAKIVTKRLDRAIAAAR